MGTKLYRGSLCHGLDRLLVMDHPPYELLNTPERRGVPEVNSLLLRLRGRSNSILPILLIYNDSCHRSCIIRISKNGENCIPRFINTRLKLGLLIYDNRDKMSTPLTP